MAGHDRIERFAKSASRHLKDAIELLEIPTSDPNRSDAMRRHLQGARYLAGYAAECLIKAYLIDQEGCRTLTSAEDRINARRAGEGKEPIRSISRSAAGHSILYLLGLTDLVERPGYDARLWSRVAVWDTGWRYVPDAPAREQAVRFVQDVERATDWLRPKAAWR